MHNKKFYKENDLIVFYYHDELVWGIGAGESRCGLGVVGRD